MSTYEAAYKKLTTDQQDALDSLLEPWSEAGYYGRIVVPNLTTREFFLDVDTLHQFLISLLKRAESIPPGEPFDNIEEAFRLTCYSHVMKGGPVPDSKKRPYPEIVGRAVDKNHFIATLLKLYGPDARPPYFPYFYKRSQVESFTTRLSSSKELNSTEKQLFMSNFGMWITWTVEQESQEPFAFIEHNQAIEVRSSLGLEPKLRSPILLLKYPTEDIPRLIRPTIADAGLFEFFEPPPKHISEHGLTRPWPVSLLQQIPSNLQDDYQPKQRPEGVHPPIEFKFLSLPARVLS